MDICRNRSNHSCFRLRFETKNKLDSKRVENQLKNKLFNNIKLLRKYETRYFSFGRHPDDVELSCSGTIIKHIKKGLKIGIIDLTRGELGTRGTIETRDKETNNASKDTWNTIKRKHEFQRWIF